MGECYALNLVAWSAGWHLDVEARLAIEEHSVFHYTLLEVFFVPFGPLSIANCTLLTQLVPEFLGDVRCKRREQHHQVAVHALGFAFHIFKLIGANHERCHTGVVGELLNVLRHLLDEGVYRLQSCRTGFLVNEMHSVAIEEESPQALEEAAHTTNVVRIPRLAGLHWSQEHLIEAEGVGTMSLHYVIGVHHVIHRLRHLLDSPSADVLAIFKNKLGVGILRAPSLECLDVEDVILNQIDVDVNLGGVVFILEVVGHKGVSVLDAVNEV